MHPLDSLSSFPSHHFSLRRLEQLLQPEHVQETINQLHCVDWSIGRTINKTERSITQCSHQLHPITAPELKLIVLSWLPDALVIVLHHSHPQQLDFSGLHYAIPRMLVEHGSSGPSNPWLRYFDPLNMSQNSFWAHMSTSSLLPPVHLKLQRVGARRGERKLQTKKTILPFVELVMGIL